MLAASEQKTFERERAELECVLSSPALKRAPSLRRILSYVCQKYFGGEIDSIREFNIGVDALDRGVDFDPESDSIVRVEACRLRRRLLEYYRNQGADHNLQILLPESGYIPQFVSKHEPDRAEPRVQLEIADRGPILPQELADLISQPAGSVHAAADREAVRVLAGLEMPKHIDSGGRVWHRDQYFRGGTIVSRPGRRILRTLDPDVYTSAREGDFTYDIPLKPGLYELHLLFAEIVYGEGSVESGGDGSRRFDVDINGQPCLRAFDIVRNAAGPNTADEVVLADVTPAPDGFLHLSFSSVVGKALLSGLEILPGNSGRMMPVRILPGARQYYDAKGNLWQADRYFLGGRVERRAAIVQGTEDPGLYTSERWGHFSYAIPVTAGIHTVRLLFAEQNFGSTDFGLAGDEPPGPGNRMFDVYCNGETLLRGLDIFKEAGGPNRALEKTFRGLRPNAQGKLILSFVPIKDYATVGAIEVTEERDISPWTMSFPRDSRAPR